MFWEVLGLDGRWEIFQSTVAETSEYAGREKLLLWQSGRGELAEYAQLGWPVSRDKRHGARKG